LNRRAPAAIAIVLAVVGSVGLFLAQTRTGEAMPPFAQALKVDCSNCHTSVPALNAFGRFVQRTGYGALDPATIHSAMPVWIGESAFFDTSDPNKPHQLQTGNLAVHAIGYLGNAVTFHYQQWITQNDKPGGIDTLWLSYDRLFHGDGHLFVGKIEPPAPSPYSQWFELAGFASPSITVGQHNWELGANRWGTKLQYSHEWLEADAGYLGSSNDLSGAGDFSSDQEKTFQWRTAWAVQDKPLEYGFYGSSGVAPISVNIVDQYHSTAIYAELDPVNDKPGLFTTYQRGFDSHPNIIAGTASSTAFSIDAFEPAFHDRVMLGVRHEYTDDGLGTATTGNDFDVEWEARKSVTTSNVSGLLVNAELATGESARPVYRYQIWYVTTIGPLR